MDRQRLKTFIQKNPGLFRFATGIYNHLHPKNRLILRGGVLQTGISLIKGLKINSSGQDNTVVIEDLAQIHNCTISIQGSHCRVKIGQRAYLSGVELCLEDDYSEIIIGDHSYIHGPTNLSAIEGTRIQIGRDCLFSGNIHFRTGDSHSLLDLRRKRVNASKDIIIDDHVWIGTRTICLKGVRVCRDSVVAAATTLCKAFEQPNVVIAGTPGKIVKTDINWDINRIPMGEE